MDKVDSRTRVMVVDDEIFMLKLLARQLKNLGYTDVERFETGHDALKMLESDPGRFDIVFCDLQMPEMDGVEFIRHLGKIQFPGALVLVSGEDERILQTAAKLSNARGLHTLGVLHKPVKPEQLGLILQGRLVPAAGFRQHVRHVYQPDVLRQAIAGGQLVNHYQPKICLSSGAVTGVEVLVRWQNPERGLVFPDQFLATIEDHGLMDELTTAVFSAALRDARTWRDAGLDLHVAVNVSMSSLSRLDFPDFIEGVAQESGIALEKIVLEVTETQVMSDPVAAFDIFARLRLKHIGLAIDDFGTGHSSLAQLRDIPFTELKIDRGFVHGACRDSSLHAFLTASLGLATQLGISTVAEGVEDRDDWDFLRASRCAQAQGWFISKAMPAAEVAGWVDKWQMRRETSGGNPA